MGDRGVSQPLTREIRQGPETVRILRSMLLVGVAGGTWAIAPLLRDAGGALAPGRLWLLLLPLISLVLLVYAPRLVRAHPLAMVFGMPIVYLVAAAIFLVATDTRLPVAMMYFGLPVMFAAHQLRARLAWTVNVIALVALAITAFQVSPRDDAIHSVLFAAATMGTITLILMSTRDQVEALIRRARHLAERDMLTGLIQRRSFEQLVRSVPLADAALVLVDVDRFKALNDTHGHHVGDQALRAIAEVLSTAVRAQDIACRWGGDEFVLVCPGLAPHDAKRLADRLPVQVSALELLDDGGARVPLSVTVGVAHSRGSLAGEESTDLWGALYSSADHALYAAKAAGRGRAAGITEPRWSGAQRRPIRVVSENPTNTTASGDGDDTRSASGADASSSTGVGAPTSEGAGYEPDIESVWYRRGLRRRQDTSRPVALLLVAVALLLMVQSVVSYLTTGYPAFSRERLSTGWLITFVVGLPVFLLVCAFGCLRLKPSTRWILGMPTLIAATTLATFATVGTGDDTAGGQFICLAILAMAIYQLRTRYAVLAAVLAVLSWTATTVTVRGWDEAPPTLVTAGLVTGALTGLLSRSRDEEQALLDHLDHQALRDGLTGAASRHAMAAWTRRHAPGLDRVGLVITDLDGFKAVNDTRGHPVGDELLHHLVRVLHTCVRPEDLLVRLGGDEFAVLVADTTPEGLAGCRERIEAALRASPLLLDDGSIIPVTASCGSAHAADAAQPVHDTLDPLFVLADAEMYEAKRSRRAHLPSRPGGAR